MKPPILNVGCCGQENVASWREGWIKDFMMHHEITGMVYNSSAKPCPLPFSSFLTESRSAPTKYLPINTEMPVSEPGIQKPTAQVSDLKI